MVWNGVIVVVIVCVAATNGNAKEVATKEIQSKAME